MSIDAEQLHPHSSLLSLTSTLTAILNLAMASNNEQVPNTSAHPGGPSESVPLDQKRYSPYSSLDNIVS
jgi:hypothetical protein